MADGIIYIGNPFFDFETDGPEREELRLYAEGTVTEYGNGVDEPQDCDVNLDYFELDGAKVDRALLEQTFGERWSDIEDDLEIAVMENR